MDAEIELIFNMIKELLQPSGWKIVWEDRHHQENRYSWHFTVSYNQEKGLALMELREFRLDYYSDLKKEAYFVNSYTDAILLGQKLFPIWIEELT